VSAAIVLAVVLAACGSSGGSSPGGQVSASAKQTIVFATAGLGSEAQATTAEIKAFEKVHPNIKVKVLHLAATSNDAYEQVVHYFEASSSTPDVVDSDTAWPASFARAGWILPLSSYGISSSALLPKAVASGTYLGKLYAAMWYFNAEGLYYRTDLVKTPPKTPQQLVTDAETALKSDHSLKEGLALEGMKYEGFVTVFIDLMGAFGGGLNPAHFDTPGNLQALDFLHNLLYDYKITPQAVGGWSEQNVQDAFTSGQAVFATNWPYLQALVNAKGSAVIGKTGFVPFPSVSGSGVATVASDALVINTKSSHRAADVDFVKWMLSPAQQIRRAIISGDPPSVKAAYTSALFKQAPYFRADLAVFNAGVPRLVSPNYLQISSDVQAMLSSVLANQASPAQALKQTASQLASLAK
jgi:multiple sugar transport system substrate-binding protein